MAKKIVTFETYVKKALEKTNYEKGEIEGVIVAEVAELPGCFTQGNSYEEARANIKEAIELWLTVGLRKGEDVPEIDGCSLAGSVTEMKRKVNWLIKLSKLNRLIMLNKLIG